jgi:hypothetical protein
MTHPTTARATGAIAPVAPDGRGAPLTSDVPATINPAHLPNVMIKPPRIADTTYTRLPNGRPRPEKGRATSTGNPHPYPHLSCNNGVAQQVARIDGTRGPTPRPKTRPIPQFGRTTAAGEYLGSPTNHPPPPRPRQGSSTEHEVRSEPTRPWLNGTDRIANPGCRASIPPLPAPEPESHYERTDTGSGAITQGRTAPSTPDTISPSEYFFETDNPRRRDPRMNTQRRTGTTVGDARLDEAATINQHPGAARGVR